MELRCIPLFTFKSNGTGRAVLFKLLPSFKKFVNMEDDVLRMEDLPSTPSHVIASLLQARIKDVHAGDVKNALLSDDKSADALDELIAVGEAAFTFIRYSDLDMPFRNAMSLLEKQFDFYRKLLEKMSA
jgi:hypothetical protein